MQSFATGLNSVLNLLPGSCLKKPVNRGGCIEDYHRASRSSRTNRAVSISSDTGLCLCRRCRNSRSVGLSAISFGKRHARHGSASFQAPVQGIGNITNLDHP
jgi:hypothetical protein